MTGGKDEAIAIDPVGIVGVDAEGVTEKDGPDLGGSEGKPEMARTTFVDGIDGKAASLGGGLTEEIFVEVAHNGMSGSKTPPSKMASIRLQ